MTRIAISDYNSIIESINDSIYIASTKKWGSDFLRDLQSIKSTVSKELPKEFPSTNILTDFSNKTLSYLEQKK